MDKYKFDVSFLDYFGHHFDATGIKPIADKAQAIVNFFKPSNMRQLRRLIDMNAFYKKFIPNYSEITRPIFALLSPHKYSKKTIEWTKDWDDAFQELLEKLCSSITWLFQSRTVQHISLLMLEMSLLELCCIKRSMASYDRWHFSAERSTRCGLNAAFLIRADCNINYCETLQVFP